MKRILWLTMALLLCLGLFGCEDAEAQSSTSATETEAIETETVVLDEVNRVYGDIIKRKSPDILVVKLCSADQIEEWGEIVQVVTDEAESWEIKQEITVEFTTVQRCHDSTEPVRIIAQSIEENMRFLKPILYFYPETPTVCSAKLTLNGQLTCTYPEHGKDGWKNFTAYPDGTLVFPDGKEYYALYWEGVQAAAWDFSQGYCVRGEDTAAFLEWALAEQGLTAREANEFIVYWLPQMQENRYNVITFQTDAYTDSAPLEITPAPDSLLRVFMVYYPTDIKIEIAPQTFEGFVRSGFTVVEWGGSQISEP